MHGKVLLVTTQPVRVDGQGTTRPQKSLRGLPSTAQQFGEG